MASTNEKMTISEHDAWYKDLRFGYSCSKVYPLGLQRTVRFGRDHENKTLKVTNPLRALFVRSVTHTWRRYLCATPSVTHSRLRHGVAALGNSSPWCRKNLLKRLRQPQNRPNAASGPGPVASTKPPEAASQGGLQIGIPGDILLRQQGVA